MSSRYALAATLWLRAEEVALALSGESLVSVRVKLQRASALYGQACAASREDVLTLHSQAWRLIISALPYLSRRLDTDSLGAGRCSVEEARFYRAFTVTKQALLSSVEMDDYALERAGQAVGYTTLLTAAFDIVRNIYSSLEPLNIEEVKVAEAFVLRVIDQLPVSRRHIVGRFGEETVFASQIDRVLAMVRPPDAFCRALHAHWTAPAVVDMRRFHDVEYNASEMGKTIKRVEAQRDADVAAHGLKTCALPSCAKREATVRQYKFCSACCSTWYCSEEHGAQHWKEHKPVCRTITAAKRLRLRVVPRLAGGITRRWWKNAENALSTIDRGARGAASRHPCRTLHRAP